MTSTELSLSQLLDIGAQKLDVKLEPLQKNQLLHFVDLLFTWNQAYNLTAIRQPDQMLIKHVLDSLSVAHLLQGNRILDVGTGAGIPGLILAILYPEKDFHLLDSNGKKTRFVTQAAAELKLCNVQALQKRVEQYQNPAKYTTIVSRAFSSLANMIQSCAHLLATQAEFSPASSHSSGIMLAMKAALVEDEVAEAFKDNSPLANAFSCQIKSLSVPFLDESRYAVCVTKH